MCIRDSQDAYKHSANGRAPGNAGCTQFPSLPYKPENAPGHLPPPPQTYGRPDSYFPDDAAG